MLTARASTVFILPLLIFLLTSCEEHMRLFKEKPLLEAELTRQQEIKAQYDAKLVSLGIHPFAAASDLEQNIIVTEKAGEDLKREIAELSAKKTAAEQAIAGFRTKLDAYRNLQSK